MSRIKPGDPIHAFRGRAAGDAGKAARGQGEDRSPLPAWCSSDLGVLTWLQHQVFFLGGVALLFLQQIRPEEVNRS